MSYRAEIAEMLRKMPSDWHRQYRVGRATLARNGGPVLPDAPTPEQAMLIIANTAGGNFDTDKPTGDQPVPKAVRDAAMKGLRLSYKNNYGGWEFFGIARAIQLALVPKVPMRTRERMVRYLEAHEKDKAGSNFGNDAKPSRGYMAWLNWGGDPAVAWNERDGIKRATYGAARRRNSAASTAAVKVGAKVGLKGAGKLVPVVGEALMAYDMTQEGRRLYRERKEGKKHSLREAGARLASSALVGSEGVAWAQKKLEGRKAKKNPTNTIKYDREEGELVVPPGYVVRLTKLGKMRSDPERVARLAELVPERETHAFALHPANWASTFASLSGKDRDKVMGFKPEAVLLTPDTLVGEMKLASRYLWHGNEEDALAYRDSVRRLTDVDIQMYRQPELLVPRTQAVRAAKKNPRDLRGRFVPPRYLAGLSASEKKQRIAELTASRDAYGTGDFSELPSDRLARKKGLVKMSPYSRAARERGIEWRGSTDEMAGRVLAYYGVRSGKRELSEALRQSYARGLAAWKSGGHRPGATARNWADARVHSFVTGGKTTWTGDADLFRSLPKSLRAAIERQGVTP